MPMRKKGEVPPYTRHQSGQACVSVRGKRTYLGVYGTPESRRRYREWLDRWEREQAGLPPPAGPGTMGGLARAFLEHAKGHYRRADGTQTSEYRDHAAHLADLLSLQGHLSPADYRAVHLEQLRSLWVGRGWARSSANKGAGMIRHVFKWGLVRGLVPPEAVASLSALPGLEEGRTAAYEPDPVPAAPEEHVLAVLPHISPAQAAMARLQWHAGLRPGEACRLLQSEVRRDGTARWGRHVVRLPDGGAWVLQPGQHKNRHRGKFLAYVLGPQARAVLQPWLKDGCHDAPVFPSPSGGCYREPSYYRAVERACERAGVPPWTPNQLRHAYISRVEHDYDILDAAKAAGHSTPQTTLGYVAADLRRAAEIAAKMG
jgi:integrase